MFRRIFVKIMQLWNCTYQITNHLSFYMCKINVLVWLVVLTCCIIQSGLVLITAWIASLDVCSNKLVNKKYWPFQSRIQLTLRDDKDRCPHVHWYWSTSPLQPGILFYKYKKVYNSPRLLCFLQMFEWPTTNYWGFGVVN